MATAPCSSLAGLATILAGGLCWNSTANSVSLVAISVTPRTPASAERAPGALDLLEVVAQAERIAREQVLWPGFDFQAVPLVLYDGNRTLQFHAAQPLPGFTDLADHPGVFVHQGLHASVRANTATKIDGVLVAVAMLPAKEGNDSRSDAAVVIHEAFHVFQFTKHPGWTANEAECFTFPMHDVPTLALQQAEDEALANVASAVELDEVRAWAQTALDLRSQRVARMPAGAAKYERDLEVLEGLAHYVQVKAAGRAEAVLHRPDGGFAADQVRRRGYWTGAQLAMTLDRLDSEWRNRLEQNEHLRLHDLVRDALQAHPVKGKTYTPAETDRFQKQAQEHVDRLLASRRASRDEFFAAPGCRLEILAAPGQLLGPMGFDPMNVKVLAPRDVLHLRYLKMGNQSGSIELLNRRALTFCASDHPLFPGAEKLIVTGLQPAPVLEVDGEHVRLSLDGLKLDFAPAAVEQSPGTIIVRLR